MNQIIDDFKNSLLNLNRLGAESILQNYNKSNQKIQYLEDLVVPAMEQIGLDWEKGKVALTQVYMSGRICEEILESILSESNVKKINHPKTAIVVLQDYHFLGKRIVTSVLRASGYKITDYGSIHDINTLLSKVKADQIKILLISTLMLNSALKVKEIHEKIHNEKIDLKIIVGGAPFRFDKKLWREVGADAMATNAAEGIKVVGDIIKEVVL